ncbi:MAG: carotenoid 1,2-hydratase [Rubrivivax sp.]|nr:carotenoid 1,2-hydratase [Rubrivivax sp.]
MDAVSEDGRHALTLIAFIGSVFSPYYRRAFRRDAQTDPADHCALNVCLYSPGARRWTMTERGRRHVHRDETHLEIGPSALHWQGDELSIRIQERSLPFGQRVQGHIRLQAPVLTRYAAALDAAGRHRWRPLAPTAQLVVELDQPRLQWRGRAYLDSNEGDEPIDQGFERWDWVRATARDGRTTVIYDTTPRHGPGCVLAHQFAPDGSDSELEAPPPLPLGATRWWRVQRQLRAAPSAEGQQALVRQTLEDTPFYARSLIHLPSHHSQPMDVVHETLDAQRLRQPLVQWMLPFRMPRRS